MTTGRRLSSMDDPGETVELDEVPHTGPAMFMCGGGQILEGDTGLRIYRYLCPYCLGHGRWGPAGDRCYHCGSVGMTNSDEPGVDLWNEYPPGVEPPITAARPLPRPPAVMRRPCVDCAYRPGSPEEETRPAGEHPFYCHHGMLRAEEDGQVGYLSAASFGGQTLGGFVCAGWWALVTGEPLPAEPFRDPGGADRPEAVPQPENPGG